MPPLIRRPRKRTRCSPRNGANVSSVNRKPVGSSSISVDICEAWAAIARCLRSRSPAISSRWPRGKPGISVVLIRVPPPDGVGPEPDSWVGDSGRLGDGSGRLMIAMRIPIPRHKQGLCARLLKKVGHGADRRVELGSLQRSLRVGEGSRWRTNAGWSPEFRLPP